MHKPGQNTTHTLLGNSAWIFLIRFFPALASLLMMLLLSRHIDASFYGAYQQIWVQAQLIGALAALGIPALFITIPLDTINKIISKIEPIAFLFIGLWILVAAVVFSYMQFSFLHGRLIYFTLCFLSGTVITTIGEAYLLAGRRYMVLLVANLFYALIFIFIHWWFIAQIIGFETLLNTLLAIVFIKMLVVVGGAAIQFRAGAARSAENQSSKQISSLWFHLGLYDIIQVLFRWGDKFVLSFLLSGELFAIYFNGTIEIPFLALLLGAVGSALLLQMNKSSTNEKDRIKMVKESSGRLSLIVFPLFLFFVLFRHELFTVVFTHRYAAAVPLFLINCFIIPLRCYNFTSILQHKGKGRVINAGAVLDLIVALVIVYPLYLLWGLNGVTLAFVISTYIQALFYLWQTARTLDCSLIDLLPLKQWLKHAIIFSILFIALYYPANHFLNPFNTLLLGGSATLVILSFVLVNVFIRKKI